MLQARGIFHQAMSTWNRTGFFICNSPMCRHLSLKLKCSPGLSGSMGLQGSYTQRQWLSAAAILVREERRSAQTKLSKLSNLRTVPTLATLRSFSLTSHLCDLSDQDVKRKIDDITSKFMEAREMIDDAKEVQDTVYFSEDMEEAVEAVKETLDLYQNLLSQLNEDQRQNVIRTIGLKMEELKAQKQMLEEEAKHTDH